MRQFLLTVGWLLGGALVVAAADGVRSHPPMRPLPTASQRPLPDSPRRFVDVTRGQDTAAGTEAAPWKTLKHAVRQLRSGETLLVRGGVYHEHVALTQSGTADAPITIRGYPGELAILDGGLREFLDSPESSWRPFDGGAPGEFVSTRTYFDADDRQPPRQFLPGSWEPMWGIEEERPLALGHFADSMVPLHGYRLAIDLRSDNEYWLGNKNEMRDTGLSCGPGLWFNRETGRIHIRLAHHRLEGLGDHAYRGETDPRKLPLVIAVSFGNDVLRITGVKHVRIQDVVLRGATGSPMINVYGSQNVDLDRIAVYGGFPALLVNASQDLRITHSAFRGLAAAWTARAHMKYRGTASYQIVLQNNQPVNERIEFAHCEFTDDHDFAYLRPVKQLQFHHNFVDNFNDDGLECGPKLREHTLFIAQNRIGRCLIPFTQHEIDKDDSPLDHNPAAGVFVYRNVIDLRGGTYKSPPKEADSTGDYLRQEGHLVGDHGGPIWPVMHVYHNTLLRDTPVFRDSYLFGLGSQGLRNTERDVFNNVFVQTDRVPGVGFVAMKQAENVREGGNILWGLGEGPALDRDPFAKFRASPLFLDSQNRYPAGWTTDDRIADPHFVRLTTDRTTPPDLRLQPGSPAVNAGVPIPADWPDLLRDADGPDAGALPLSVSPWGVGIDGRVPLFGE
ncbi:MAG: hypothetical protein SH850_00925 [Planctomycetaceae bacterium]|nr:hypothetical protein [Planctomycetaceae bacterium]